MNRSGWRRFVCLTAILLASISGSLARAQDAAPTSQPTQHPALFLVGDSIMATGKPDDTNERLPHGMGWELIPRFDSGKIHVYNVGLGGRSSRLFIDEGAWAKVLDRMQAGDFVLVMFAHNDEANSQNYPDRTSIMGSGPETVQIGIARPAKIIHTYGWYLQQYVKDAKAKGGTVILCSPVPRNQWIDGKLKRGFDGYAKWAEEAAKASGAPFIDLNTLSADKLEPLGQQGVRPYFADNQHTTILGAKLNADSVITGLKQLKDVPLAGMLLAPKADAGLIKPMFASADAPALQTLYVVGDSTAAKNRSATIQGWGEPFLAYFNPEKINVVNAALGGRSSRSYIVEGQLDKLVEKLKPGDDVLLQWGHNDAYDLAGSLRRGTLHGLGEETMEVDTTGPARNVNVAPSTQPAAAAKMETIHTFGWYMRKQIAAIREKGANPIILTLTIRDRWNKDGTIERLPVPNLDLTNTNRFHEPPIYSTWSAEVAKQAKLPLIDVHNIIADRYEREGKAVVDTYFNSASDPTHRNPKGAAVDAECTMAGLKALKGPAYDQYLSDAGKAVPAADAKYIFRNAPAVN